ncbi:hypothetical protein HYW55_05465 [Candidatus Gottesmanbacteria bacterium]|nr:hypothetical protein [Candidatus Gottesmanbacteria bacterium]
MREKITFMPLNQIRLLLKIADSPNKETTVSGKSEGAIVKQLYRKGYVHPRGKIGRAIRWSLNTVWFSDSDFALMRELIKNS